VTVATNEQKRRAIGSNNEAARRAIGTNNQSARRAIGQRIEAERRGESVVQDLNRLITPAQQRRTLRPVQPAGALPATRGRANYTPPPATNTGGGTASPLTEASALTREWWGTGWPSTDGIFEYPAEKKVLMADANGAPVEFRYAGPEL
jgi:hypothetical protein